MMLNALWIGYETGPVRDRRDLHSNPSPYFRKAFTLMELPKKATLTVSAIGVYKAYLNGSAVGEDYLSPGWTDFHRRIPCVAYDVTALLQKRNAIGVILADGWAAGFLFLSRNCYSDRIWLAAELRLEYADRTEYIRTDKSWKAHDGAIRRSDLYAGEYIDARLSLGDFSAVDYDDSAWEPVESAQGPLKLWQESAKNCWNMRLEPAIAPPTVVKHRLQPTLLLRDGSRAVYDFGQNFTGVLRCTLRGERGATVTFRHAEIMDGDRLYTENLRKAEATDTYILAGGGDETFRPLFTFHGFRYAEITVDGKAEVSDLVGECMYSDLAQTGDFTCSDEVVSKVFRNALWSNRDNFLNVPTDCPQRSERLGYLGDAQIFCKSAMYNMDCDLFFRKYLADIRDAQYGNGAMPAVAPLPHVGSFDFAGWSVAAGWAEAIMVIPYTHYRMYGDPRVLIDNLPAAKRLLDYYDREAGGGLRSGEREFGDWLSVGVTTEHSLLANLYYAYGAYLTAEMCRIVRDPEERYYRALFSRIRRDFRDRYWRGGRLQSDGRLDGNVAKQYFEGDVPSGDTQTAYALAYRFGLLTADEARDNLVRKVEEADRHLTTGFLGVKYLLPVLCDLGRSDLAYAILTNRTYPGWGYSVVNGATTVWERWNSYTQEGGVSEKSMNSFNHYSLGSCVEWMYEYCLGIKPKTSGFGSVRIAPYLDRTGRITSASGHYRSYAVSWRREGDRFFCDVSLPKGANAEFDFPGMTVTDRAEDDSGIHFILECSK
ncbi:MAG: family 78 glycoside hydrolase catalytic domain [Oscillospiraceae bacterium]|nr:family 78 glycoside hydrolase catalytic domain [Oscillospiraceae bacterium]